MRRLADADIGGDRVGAVLLFHVGPDLHVFRTDRATVAEQSGRGRLDEAFVGPCAKAKPSARMKSSPAARATASASVLAAASTCTPQGNFAASFTAREGFAFAHVADEGLIQS